MAGELDVAISSPATTGNDATAVAGTALPFNVSAPELLTLPTGSAAIAAQADSMRMTKHTYFIGTSCESLFGEGFARFHHINFAAWGTSMARVAPKVSSPQSIREACLPGTNNW